MNTLDFILVLNMCWKKKSLNGIEGAVAEIIDTPSKLTTAIEIALGASLQHIIVREEKDARLAIKYLKDKKLGRATFLPMNVVKNDLYHNLLSSKLMINMASLQ